jgi:molybdenum cofactor biosynthesis protein B
MHGIDKNIPFQPVRIAVLTVSDTRTPRTDKSGTLLGEMLTASGHQLSEHAIAKDDIDDIRATITRWTDDPNVDVIITTGGTGFTGRDVTPEAVRPLFDKEIDGFSTAFHMLSFDKVGTSTIQSRACGGLIGNTYIFCVPGSPGACKDAWKGILQYQLDIRHKPCNFVELMPRLQEHLEPGQA